MNTLTEIKTALEELGYKATLTDTAVTIELCRFTAALTINDNSLFINCQVASGEEIGDEIGLYLLDLNSSITPYAFALLTAKTDGEKDTLLVLTDSVSLLTFSKEELEQTIDQLRNALFVSGPILRQKNNYSSIHNRFYFDTNDLYDGFDLLDEVIAYELMFGGFEEVIEEVIEEVVDAGVEEYSHSSSYEETHSAAPEPERSSGGFSSFGSSDSYSSGGGYDSGGSSDCGGGDCGGGCD